MSHIKELFFLLKNDNLSLLYQGIMNDSLTELVVQLSESNFESLMIPQKVTNKVSFIMVECFQNIVRHGIDDEPFGNFFQTRTLPSFSYVTSANLVEKENISEIENAILSLNKLSKDELKELYLNNLSGGVFSSKGGAGLGLIEMARKSSNKLEYSFVPFNKDKSHFFLSTKIINNTKDSEIDENEDIGIAQSIELQKLMIQNGVIIAFKSSFTKDSIIPILKMAESNLSENNDVETNKKLTYSIIELSQNIAKHGFKRNDKSEGVLTISVINSHFYVSTANLIEKHEENRLKNKLEILNKLDPSEIEAFYLKSIQESVLANDQDTNGFGLIDLINITNEKYIYEFTPFDNKLTLFTISIKI
ncbi:MAG: hypothetical protein A2033_05145 [Bacteroidetes bacterium GWA2_31_9]|nr:MAG: hypothetical protein A2033_05145 [Bacteroidetes bacterium GWA2_31_9]